MIGAKDALGASFYGAFVDAFGGRDGVELLMSVGASVDSFTDLPRNVTVRRHVPQTAVLAHTDVFFSHMGANSMHEALFHGVPLVCSPHWGDMIANTERVVALGAGVHLPLTEISAVRVAAAAERAIACRANAARLAGSLEAGGGLERALQIIAART